MQGRCSPGSAWEHAQSPSRHALHADIPVAGPTCRGGATDAGVFLEEAALLSWAGCSPGACLEDTILFSWAGSSAAAFRIEGRPAGASGSMGALRMEALASTHSSVMPL